MEHRKGNTEPERIRSESFLVQAMDEWGGSVWRLALSLTGSKHDAEDVYQDVFIRLARDQTVFSSKEHLKAWLLRVTTNRCYDFARQRHRHPLANLDDLPFELAETSPLTRDEVRELWEAVEALPENMRAIVHLFYYEGYSGDEIAHIVGIEPSTVRSRLQRARARLKTTLGGAEHEQEQPIQGNDGSNPATCIP